MSDFLSENFPFLVVKFSVYLNWRVFVMKTFSLGVLFYMEVLISDQQNIIRNQFSFLFLCFVYKLFTVKLISWQSSGSDPSNIFYKKDIWIFFY